MNKEKLHRKINKYTEQVKQYKKSCNFHTVNVDADFLKIFIKCTK